MSLRKVCSDRCSRSSARCCPAKRKSRRKLPPRAAPQAVTDVSAIDAEAKIVTASSAPVAATSLRARIATTSEAPEVGTPKTAATIGTAETAEITRTVETAKIAGTREREEKAVMAAAAVAVVVQAPMAAGMTLAGKTLAKMGSHVRRKVQIPLPMKL